MRVLYYMDPFVDMDYDFDDRSFVAKTDLNADFLGKFSKTEKSLTVYFTALESLLEKRELRQHLKTSGVNIISTPIKRSKGYWPIITRQPTWCFPDRLNRRLKRKSGNICLGNSQNCLPIL